jgi:hypothetical protein
MGSTGKKKTTMAKLARESRLRERRAEKEARKEARKHAAAHPPVLRDDPSVDGQEYAGLTATGGSTSNGLLDRAAKSSEPEASSRTQD